MLANNRHSKNNSHSHIFQALFLSSIINFLDICLLSLHGLLHRWTKFLLLKNKTSKMDPFSYVSLLSHTYISFFQFTAVFLEIIFTMPLFPFIYPLTTLPAFLHCFIKGLQWSPISSHTVRCLWSFHHIEKPLLKILTWFLNLNPYLISFPGF